MANEQKFPSETIDLPSKGKLYPKESVLSSGKLEIKYMTAKEEDILTSQNLIKKGIVIDKLIDSLILTEGITCDDLTIGDKNAVMVASRILAYGSEYTCEVINPNNGNKFTHTFNLADCPFTDIPDDVKDNNFEIELPVSKKKIGFKILTGKDEKNIEAELKSIAKLNQQVTPELTTRLRYSITSVDGENSTEVINSSVQNMLARDSMFLRNEIKKLTPDIKLEQEVDLEGESVKVNIPMTVNFFWPDTQ